MLKVAFLLVLFSAVPSRHFWAMSVRTDVINLTVNVNGNQAQNQLNELRKKTADVKHEMDGLKKGTQEYINKKVELKGLNDQMADLKKTIGITSLSQKELVSELNKLKSLRGSVIPFSDEYKALSKSIKEVDDRLYDVRNGVEGFASFFSKIKDEVKQFGVAAAAYLGFEFISSQFSNIISGAAKLSDQLADVRKVTGLSAQAVTELNKEIKSIDTRTANTQLRELAIDAGKLGIEGRDKILQFVEAADQINVALGEDLGEDAVKDLGKLVDIFNITDDFGLKESMLKVGSAINEVGANSAATEAYIVDFTKRLGGIAPAANISIENVIALGGTLDSLGIQSELASTAIGNTLSKLVTDFKGFGKIAGIKPEELKSIYDAKGGLEALKAVLEGVKKSGGGFDQLVAKLGDIGIEGSRAKSVFAVLSNNLDKLEEQQSVSNDAFKEGISITEEFAIKNDTFGASLDKLSKHFSEIVTSSAVTNFLKGAVDGALAFINVLIKIPKFLDDNSTALKFLIAGIVLLNFSYIKSSIAIVANTIAKLQNTIATRATAIATAIAEVAQASYVVITNLLTGRIILATAAQRLWAIALSIGLGPLGIIISLVGAAAVAFSIFAGANQKSNTALSVQAETLRESNKELAKQKAEIEGLTAVITSNSISLGTREASLKKLITISPEYLNRLTLENLATAEGKRILDTYNKSLEASANIKAAGVIQERENAEDIRLRSIKQELEIFKTTKDFGALGKEAKRVLSDELPGAGRTDNALNSIEESIKKQSGSVKAATENFVNQTKIQEDARRQFLLNEITAAKKEQLQTDKTTDAYKKNTEKLIAARKKFDDEFGGKNTKTTVSSSTIIDPDKDKADKKANEKAFKKSATEIDKLREEWQKLNRDISDTFALLPNDPFAQGISKANKEAEESVEKINAFLKKKIIDQQQYADASIKIEAIRYKKIEDLVAKFVKPVSDRDPLALSKTSQTITGGPKDFTADAERLSRDFIAGEELTSITKRGKARLTAQLNILALEKAQELSNKNLTENEIALIEEKYREKSAQASLDSFLGRAQAILDFSNNLLSVASTINDTLNNIADREFAKEKKRNDEKAAGYKKLLDAKQISQRKYNNLIANLDEDLAKKKHDIDTKAFKRQQKLAIIGALINGAQGVVSTLAAKPGLADIFTLGVARAIMVGLVVASTAAQIFAISSQKAPEAGQGALLSSGPYHRDKEKGLHVVNPRTGITELLLEKDEMVVKGDATRDRNTYTVTGTPAQIGSKLNSMHGGVSWAGGAVINMPRFRTERPASINTNMPRIMAQGGVFNGPTATQNNNSNVSAQADQTALVEQILARHDQSTERIMSQVKSFNTSLHSVVSIKEYRAKEAQYEAARKASGLNQ